jgi:hypothetical protein
MAIKSVCCRVAQGNVTVVTDLEGRTVRVICPEYEYPTGACRVRKDALKGGPLSQLLEHVSEDTLDTRTVRCNLS